MNPQVTVTSDDSKPSDDAQPKGNKKRTLTNLYNARPTWLDLAHKRLDEAVFAAYGWKTDLSDEHPSGMLRRDSGEVTVPEFGEKSIPITLLD